MASQVGTLLWGAASSKCHCQVAEFLQKIFITLKFQIYYTLLNTIHSAASFTRKEYLVSFPKNHSCTQQQWWTLAPTKLGVLSRGRILGRNPAKSLKSFPPCYSDTPTTLPWDFYFFKLMQPLTHFFKIMQPLTYFFKLMQPQTYFFKLTQPQKYFFKLTQPLKYFYCSVTVH